MVRKVIKPGTGTLSNSMFEFDVKLTINSRSKLTGDHYENLVVFITTAALKFASLTYSVLVMGDEGCDSATSQDVYREILTDMCVGDLVAQKHVVWRIEVTTNQHGVFALSGVLSGLNLDPNVSNASDHVIKRQLVATHDNAIIHTSVQAINVSVSDNGDIMKY
jgi:hypothetical protein